MDWDDEREMKIFERIGEKNAGLIVSNKPIGKMTNAVLTVNDAFDLPDWKWDEWTMFDMTSHSGKEGQWCYFIAFFGKQRPDTLYFLRCDSAK